MITAAGLQSAGDAHALHDVVHAYSGFWISVHPAHSMNVIISTSTIHTSIKIVSFLGNKAGR